MQEDIGLVDGVIVDNDRVILLASSAKLEEEEVEHVFILDLKNGQWNVAEEALEAIRVVVTQTEDSKELALMSMFGRAMIFPAGGIASDEEIGDEDNGPSDLRPLNDMAQVGKALIAVGMRRQVYRRPLDQPVWTRIDDGVFIPISAEATEGFLGVDGFNESEIYAVGYEGEIWQFNGSAWMQRETPTNLRLESVKCLNTGLVIAVGEAGILLMGRGDSWVVVDQKDVQSVLISVAEFQGEIYVCSEEDGVFRLGDEELIECDTGVGSDVLFQRLYATPYRLLAVAEAAALVYDGNSWQELDLPTVRGI